MNQLIRHPIVQSKIDPTELQTDNLIPTCIQSGRKIKTIAIKKIPVDQSSCNSSNDLIQEIGICKTVP